MTPHRPPAFGAACSGVSLGVDCHAHVFGPGVSFSRDPVYVPEPDQMGTAAEFTALLRSHGLTHGVLVAAQPYVYDCRCMLEALDRSNGRFKGIALAPPSISDGELAALNDHGVIGVRINLSTYGTRELTEPGVDRLLARIRELGWWLEIHCEKDELVDAADIVMRSEVNVIIDHFGRPDVTRGTSQPGFHALLELGRAGTAVVKLSGPFRCSIAGPPYDDVDPFIEAAIDAFTLDRCVWGSDWPFVRVDRRVDYGPQLACLSRWLPDEHDRTKVLWDNPRRLFGFTA